MVFRVGAFEVVEDAFAFIHTTGPEQITLLTVIEAVNKIERDVVELEIALEAIGALHQLADPVTHASAVGHALRQPAQQPQRPEQRAFAGMVEKRPVAMVAGLVAGQD